MRSDKDVVFQGKMVKVETESESKTAGNMLMWHCNECTLQCQTHIYFFTSMYKSCSCMYT